MGTGDRCANAGFPQSGARGVADIVVEIDDQGGAGHLGKQALDLRIISGAYGRVVLEVGEGAGGSEQSEAFGVEREQGGERAGIADRHLVRIVLAGPLRDARRRIILIGDGPALHRPQEIERRLDGGSFDAGLGGHRGLLFARQMGDLRRLAQSDLRGCHKAG